MRGFLRVAVIFVLFFTGLFASHTKAEPTPNAAESAEQIRAKAEQGDASAQYNLGVIYEKGQGVQQDYAKAYMWISLAADQGLEDAIKKLDYLVNILTPSQIEEGQRLAREWIATHTKAQATK